MQETIDGQPVNRLLELRDPDRYHADRGIRAWLERLARAGFVHGDCKVHNFFFDGDGIWLLDLDSMVWHASRRRAAAGHARDLARYERDWQRKG